MRRKCGSSTRDRWNGEGLFLSTTKSSAVFRCLLLALALMLSGPALAAGLSCEQSAASNFPESRKNNETGKRKGALIKVDKDRLRELGIQLDEQKLKELVTSVAPEKLKELGIHVDRRELKAFGIDVKPPERNVVVIDRSKLTTLPEDLSAWLGLLVGEYSYDGHVDLCGNGIAADKRPVTGRADCIASGSTPNVHCKVHVSWPDTKGINGAPVLGGVSNLRPAQFVYSLESSGKRAIQISGWGIRFMQVDDKGIAEWASGVLVGDTFTSAEPCLDMPDDVCRKIIRITARPDSNEISMVADIEIGPARVLHQEFVLHRQPRISRGEQSPGSAP